MQPALLKDKTGKTVCGLPFGVIPVLLTWMASGPPGTDRAHRRLAGALRQYRPGPSTRRIQQSRISGRGQRGGGSIRFERSAATPMTPAGSWRTRPTANAAAPRPGDAPLSDDLVDLTAHYANARAASTLAAHTATGATTSPWCLPGRSTATARAGRHRHGLTCPCTQPTGHRHPQPAAHCHRPGPPAPGIPLPDRGPRRPRGHAGIRRSTPAPRQGQDGVVDLRPGPTAGSDPATAQSTSPVCCSGIRDRALLLLGCAGPYAAANSPPWT